MDSTSSTWATEDRTRCKDIVANSSVVPQWPWKVIGLNRQNRSIHADKKFLIFYFEVYLFFRFL